MLNRHLYQIVIDRGCSFWSESLQKNGFDIESKYGHERGQYLSDLNDFGVVGKPATSAIKRRQNHHEQTYVGAIHDILLNFAFFKKGLSAGQDVRQVDYMIVDFLFVVKEIETERRR